MPPVRATPEDAHDLVLVGGTIYDGSGGKPYVGDIAIDADRISYVGPPKTLRGRMVIDVHGQAVAPGFINMLAHPEESFLVDGRALSDLSQGVTLEVLGEDSMGPLNAQMKDLMVQRQGDIKFPVTWTTLGEYLQVLEQRGISPNVASFVGGGHRAHLRARRSATCSQARLSSIRCAPWCTRAWNRARSA